METNDLIIENGTCKKLLGIHFHIRLVFIYYIIIIVIIIIIVVIIIIIIIIIILLLLLLLLLVTPFPSLDTFLSYLSPSPQSYYLQNH